MSLRPSLHRRADTTLKTAKGKFLLLMNSGSGSVSMSTGSIHGPTIASKDVGLFHHNSVIVIMLSDIGIYFSKGTSSACKLEMQIYMFGSSMTSLDIILEYHDMEDKLRNLTIR